MPELMPDAAERKDRAGAVLWVGVALFVFACALRFFRLGDWSFWADELATLRDAQNLGNVRYYPVGYALIGWVVRLWGESEFAARLVPAVAGAVTVPVIYLMGTRLFSRRAGIFAGCFLTLSTYHLFFSQFARYYTLLVLITLAGMWALYRGIEEDRKGWLLAGLALLGLGFFTHWSAGLLIPAAVVYLIWSARGTRPKGLNRKNLMLLAGPVVVGGAALLPVVWGFVCSWKDGAGFSFARAALVVAKLAWRMEPALLLLGAAGAVLMLRERDRRMKWCLAYAVAPVVLVAVFVGFSQGGSRFGIVALPAVMLLAGGALDRLMQTAKGKRRILVWLVFGLILFSMSMKCAAYFTVEYGQRPRWREAGAMLHKLPHARRLTTSPAMMKHYGNVGGGRSLVKLSNNELKMTLSRSRPKNTPSFVFIEHVANVAPRPDQWKIIRQHCTKIKEWPAKAGPLDYTISLYYNGKLTTDIKKLMADK